MLQNNVLSEIETGVLCRNILEESHYPGHLNEYGDFGKKLLKSDSRVLIYIKPVIFLP